MVLQIWIYFGSTIDLLGLRQHYSRGLTEVPGLWASLFDSVCFSFSQSQTLPISSSGQVAYNKFSLEEDGESSKLCSHLHKLPFRGFEAGVTS